MIWFEVENRSALGIENGVQQLECSSFESQEASSPNWISIHVEKTQRCSFVRDHVITCQSDNKFYHLRSCVSLLHCRCLLQWNNRNVNNNNNFCKKLGCTTWVSNYDTYILVYFFPVYTIGQMIAYEVVHATEASCPVELIRVPVPEGDEDFRPNSSSHHGKHHDRHQQLFFPFVRSSYNHKTGRSPNRPRQPVRTSNV